MVTEISLITPPIGMNVFVLKTIMPEMSLWGIFAGIGPFFAADIVRLLLVVFIPGLALYLPNLMGRVSEARRSVSGKARIRLD